ncbi:MAG TPA: hypothetical protein VE622_04990 [Nitrososphaeraceae archaeon]|jgi:hypothetical protein|nr:hypothetical protein [Nitrososphaeraceae archaeon]
MVKKKLQLRHIKVNKIILEESCIAFEVSDVVEAASSAAEMFGIDKVAIAKQVTNRFTNIVKTIVNTGKQIILPKEKFFVKVEVDHNTKLNYVGRDVEFVSSGDLTANLSSIAAQPAKNEYDADKIILSYIGKNSAYVCIQIDKALGGLPFGSQKEKVVCSIHNTLSALSCLMAIQCGFIPELLILYTDYNDLKENVKLVGYIYNRMSIKKHKIRIARIDIPDNSNYCLKFILQESVSARILTLLPEKGLVIPLSAAIHPPWFVEATIKKIGFTGKMPWMPLMLMTDSIYYNAKYVGLEDKIATIETIISTSVLKKEEYKKHEKKIDTLSKAAIKNMKTVSLNIGPNYLHDIIDSI